MESLSTVRGGNGVHWVLSCFECSKSHPRPAPDTAQYDIFLKAHLGMQASLPQDLVPIGATTLLSGNSTSCAVFLSISQALYNNRLSTNLSQIIPPELASKVISVGATNVRSVVSRGDLTAVLQAYSNAVAEVFVCLVKPYLDTKIPR